MSLRFLAPRATTKAHVLAEVGLEAPAATQAVVDGRVFFLVKPWRAIPEPK